MHLPPLPPSLDRWRNLLTAHRRIVLMAAGGVVVLILLMTLFGGTPEKAPPHEFPQPAPQPVAPPQPPDQAALILQLFNPSDQSLTNQLSTTVFNQQIEQALTVSFILTKCQLFTQDEYSDTFRALILYAQQTKLAADEPTAEALVRQIAEAAGASYSFIYSRTPCTDKKLPVLAKQLNEWVDAVFKR